METRYTVVHGFQKLALMFSHQEEEGGTDTYIHYFVNNSTSVYRS